ncbi:deoxyribonuclease V [Leptolyngbyaceae cyanobacterium CCMR0082]|uniref:Endonuclease V n=1 Tax=Adonisia turfae CCMR0082 TaxID=2304604 RepID=A0A6M0RZG8_9CYAN|nr:deoxyribonuclease V [Adonisia turfae]MDV3352250.1 deoxyribonuclease V [Leptothoe sp. LEGE 181152]NEZ61617.1 deoxyribonuclease V [Adonisia turfae CCMR0082]
MKIDVSDTWPQDTGGAIAIQNRLRSQVITTDQFAAITTVAGIDAGFEQDGTITRAAVVVLQLPELTLLEQAIAYRPTTFPYVPSLLSFREMPTVLDALRRLTLEPDLILCDGAGIAHPRRLGIASHLGVLMDKPTIGVAKSRLLGTHGELPADKGAWVPLMDRGERIGAVLRSRTGTKPLFVSAGHRISLETAVDYVLQCTPKYRLPETTRLADRLASNRGPMPSVGTSATDGTEQMELF